ncbi:hypothetical protein BKA93DRAFT_876299 [Sparassis latifolia]
MKLAGGSGFVSDGCKYLLMPVLFWHLIDDLSSLKFCATTQPSSRRMAKWSPDSCYLRFQRWIAMLWEDITIGRDPRFRSFEDPVRCTRGQDKRNASFDQERRRRDILFIRNDRKSFNTQRYDDGKHFTTSSETRWRADSQPAKRDEEQRAEDAFNLKSNHVRASRDRESDARGSSKASAYSQHQPEVANTSDSRGSTAAKLRLSATMHHPEELRRLAEDPHKSAEAHSRAGPTMKFDGENVSTSGLNMDYIGNMIQPQCPRYYVLPLYVKNPRSRISPSR